MALTYRNIDKFFLAIVLFILTRHWVYIEPTQELETAYMALTLKTPHVRQTDHETCSK